MAFDVTTLNGVDFGSDNFSRITNFTNDPTSKNPTIASVRPAEGYDPVTYTSRDTYNASKIISAQSSYTAGRVLSDGNYILPTFGYIKFEYWSNKYYVHGFSSDGKTLLLSSQETVTSGSGASTTRILSTAGFHASDAPTFPLSFSADSSNFPAACFAEGTRLATSAGPIAVEALSVGDFVLTASGATRPVTWIGQTLTRPSRHQRPHEVNPVRVRAGAFGESLPGGDLRLSPGHAVYIDGILVPVGHLVNGATIVQEAVDEVRYFHIELESHDVVLAEGLPCESYLDDGNRASFTGGAVTALDGRLDPQGWDKACAPLVAAGPQLVEVQQRLHARAEALGWVRSEDPALRLIADGAEIAPLHATGNRYWFAVPAAAALTLASNAGVLAEVMPGLPDRRRLGVAVSELRVDGAAIALDDAALGAGFHAIERQGEHGWRWTDGAATLALASAAPAMIEVALLIVAPTWQRAKPELKIVSAA